MVYLARVSNSDIEIAACEDASKAAPYLAQGYTPVNQDAYLMYWRMRDHITLTAMIAAVTPVQERAVGWEPSGVLARVRRHRW